MTPEQQRIAIAEACGWVWYRIPNPLKTDREYRMLAHPSIHENEWQSEIWKVRADGTERVCNWKFMEDNGYVPNYLNDLNAMHEAVLSLSQDDRFKFQEQLSLIADRECLLFVELEAKHWAETFIRAVGKWQDEPALDKITNCC